MINNSDITGIILAGGKSSRMGKNKAFVEYNNKQLINHAFNTISPVCENMIISGDPKIYQYDLIPTVKDLILDIGPISGLYSCLQKSSTDINLVIPCDMPKLKPQVYYHLLENLGNSEVAVASENKKLHPACAIFRKSVIEKIKQQISISDLKLKNLLSRCDTTIVNIDNCLDWYEKDMFRNINCKDDLI